MGYWGTVTTEAQRAAVYNWSFVGCDGSMGIHNGGELSVCCNSHIVI